MTICKIHWFFIVDSYTSCNGFTIENTKDFLDFYLRQLYKNFIPCLSQYGYYN